MQRYFAVLTLVLLVVMVVTRAWLMNRQGIKAFHFGELDRRDFLIPPFVIFYFYTIFAAAFNWPMVSTRQFFQSDSVAWLGVVLCAAALLLMLWSLISFGRSFRVGIDTNHPDRLITTGVFSFSRNPIYVAFVTVLTAQFLIFPNWILMIYVAAAAWLIHRQVLLEEEFLKQHYGDEYAEYCTRVRRYL